MKLSEETKKSISETVGIPYEELVNMDDKQIIAHIEKKTGKKVVFSKEPTPVSMMGSGDDSVLIDQGKIRTMDEVDAKMNKILKEKPKMDKYQKRVARLERSNQRYNEKLKRERAKRIAKFMKFAKVPANATQEQINECCLKAIQQMNQNQFHKIALSDAQYNNPEFLLSMYSVNPLTVRFYKPGWNNETLQNNVNFMFEYIKYVMKDEMSRHSDDKSYWEKLELTQTLSSYSTAIQNAGLFELLIKEYPNVNMLEVIDDCFSRRGIWGPWTKDALNQNQHLFESVIAGLSREALISQTQKFGKDTLRHLPKTLEFWPELATAGVAVDGFDSLEYLPIQYVLDNKHLILQSYEKDGAGELGSYLTRTLSPHRTHYYMCHGEPHDYSTYEEEYAVVQQALMNDPELIAILEKEEEKGKVPSYISKIAQGSKLLCEEHPDLVKGIVGDQTEKQ